MNKYFNHRKKKNLNSKLKLQLIKNKYLKILVHCLYLNHIFKQMMKKNSKIYIL